MSQYESRISVSACKSSGMVFVHGFFLIFGHFFIFIAYRTGPAQLVAPFYYTFSVWAVISGLLVFGEFPNTLAIWGILLIIGSGLVIVMLDRRRKPVPVA